MTHFANAAGLLSKPKLVGVVGSDFTEKEWSFIRSKSSDTSCVEVLSDEKSFFWEGVYSEDFNSATTVTTELNAFARFSPVIPKAYQQEKGYLFLANIDPLLQKKVALQCPNAKLKILDTMNYWIQNTPEKLKDTFAVVDGITINEGEAFLLTGERNILKAVDKIFLPNFKMVILKKGSNGVMVFGKNYTVNLPAYPLRDVVDPTGAGDSFAGAFVSYLDHEGVDVPDREVVKNATAYATVVASFAVQGFGVDGINLAEKKDIDARMAEFKGMVSF